MILFDRRKSHLAPDIGFMCLWWVLSAVSKLGGGEGAGGAGVSLGKGG